MARLISKISFLLFLLISLSTQGSISLEQNIQSSSRKTLPLTEVQDLSKDIKINPEYGNIPLYFVPNNGQVHEKALFYARTSRYTLWITNEGLVFDSSKRIKKREDSKPIMLNSRERNSPEDFTYERDVSRLIFLNAHKNAEIVPLEMTDHKVSYFRGNDPSEWHRNIKTSKAVLYKEIYKDIDLKVYGLERQIEYDWIVKPGGDPEEIRFEYKNVRRTRIDKDGNLVIKTEFGELMHRKPVCYQILNGQRVEVKANYVINGDNNVKFKVGEYRKNRELIIDPLIYSTFLGGTEDDYSEGIAVDEGGNAYITGINVSGGFPTTPGAYDTSYDGYDVFITKLNFTGTDLVYSTYLGGSSTDHGYGIAVDGSGNAYVTGNTESLGFPTTAGAYNTSYNGKRDGFITKLNSTGTDLIYSTYLGGSSTDHGYGIAVDGSGNAYITGYTESSDFPTTPGAYDTSYNGWGDVFITKLNSTGTSFFYSTYLGGSGSLHERGDYGYGVAVDGSGNAYVTGKTYSSDFPTTPGAYDTSYNDTYDVFITKLNSTGADLIYSTYLGGPWEHYIYKGDCGKGIAVDGSGNAYVTGYTNSSDFPTTPGAYDTSYNDEYDAFITKLNSTGTDLIYSTYLGGHESDYGYGMVIDGSGNAYITGYTESSDFPTTPGAYDRSYYGENDVFITKINSTGSDLVYSTYLGGIRSDFCYGIAVDGSGNAYVTGYTESSDFPTTPGAYDRSYDGENDVFITKINLLEGDPPDTPTNPSPQNEATDVPLDTDLDWDDSSKATWYDVYFGTSSPPYYKTTMTSSFYDPGELNSDTTYYWKIVARSNNSETPGPIWKFTTVFIPHTVSTPNPPSGPSSGNTNAAYEYTAGGSSCSHGHSVEYGFYWGDGTYSNWSSLTSQSHFWTSVGTYTLKVQARCSVDTSIISDWSSGKTITINPAISGSVKTSSSEGVEGVTITFSDGGGTAITDSNGNYSYAVNSGWSGTVSPAKEGYTFSPSSVSYTNVTSDQVSQDYTATAVIPAISGTVKDSADKGIEGVTIAFSDDGGSTTTDANGNYTQAVAYNWSGTAIPSKTGYEFSPSSRAYNNVTSDQQNQAYTATVVSPTISGSVKISEDKGLEGVTITFSDNGGSTITDSKGNYAQAVPYNWSGTATPSKTGYTFSPLSKSYSNVTSDQVDQDYTATAVTPTISGTVKDSDDNGIAGVIITFSDDGGSTTTDANGNYTQAVAYNWSGTATPSKTGYEFLPSSRSYSSVTSNQTNQDYTATLSTHTISGNVSVASSAGKLAAVGGLSGVVMGGLPGDPQTDVDGNYSAAVDYGWSGTVTPTKAGYTFSPSSRTYSNVTFDQTDQDYTATLITPPEISLSTTNLAFSATTDGTKTSDQQFRISNTGGGILDWSIADDSGWLSCTPTSGTGYTVITVSVDPTGLSAKTYNGKIAVASTNASNSPQYVDVPFTVKNTSDATSPFGYFATPEDGTTGITGAIPMTGWALDDIGVESVKVYREESGSLVYIGEAVFVEGARPDIEQAYPEYPMNYRAGWGYMLLTNFLPNGGNGTFPLQAYAIDKEGNSVNLGTKTITCDNANAVKPFGAIDTPAQGGTASGSNFLNWGWALTPMPNSIPTDGSTIDVYVDSVNLGHPVYNNYREDIANNFPGYANSDGAVGYFYLDTTGYADGLHSIAWIAEDNAGNADGIGSRYFTISNTGSSINAQVRGRSQRKALDIPLSFESIMNLPINYDPISYKRGFKTDIDPEIAVIDNYGITSIEIREVERLEVDLGEGTSYRGYLVVGNQLRPLPIGSTLDTENGVFYWQPGPGFIGEYEFVFIKQDKSGSQSKIRVKIRIAPKFAIY